MRRRKRRLENRRRITGRPLGHLAKAAACRDAWYAVALDRTEDLMRDPELRDRIENSILEVLEGMVSRLRERRRRRRHS